MSLDVYLKSEAKSVKCECSHCGHQHTRIESEILFEQNVTHNLSKMATEAGIGEALWSPEEINVTKAGELIGRLGLGLDTLKSDPEHFKKFNPKNGWGNYEGLVRFVENYLNACREYPDSKIEVSR